ncbi:high frequency lysogenization protein HflD [Pseudidiomarina terrestris]|uniref:High frequency lysogenization protein HflD homolog n=1 Tax=Pseudidiomarina terrestris TaxID=2820060 RepID=A0AAW7QU25_9GAMM|nr:MULTISPECIES: high frequency lysogenization protein HflD [unclassified Pseudidiomarina]MDN7123667.1 high frequency lysogenization protein HflD [Pseudidiomarina sp. 1APP75-32.1]MDN7126543.1 high frequency lysogenization protein HflD [Pseudidiomarina sp. 1APR75-33.1]MDN7128609.1 high frequency lysogenization protein HflD [Pseudidiomarina sp. 1APR75-15]MDN7135132.1 high frequency lysogenization protein HflD [Pseudidiomarina sp. 1ASP75-5]MDN7137803.1 high frequency lysogenization protein HflD [
MNEWQQRVIALAAIAQSAAAVKNLARQGKLDPSFQRNALLDSVLVQNPDAFAAIYGDVKNLRVGLRVLLDQLGATRNKDIETTRYMVGVLALARRIQRQPAAFAKLGERIEQLHRQHTQFQFDKETIYTGMASVYSDCISPLGRPLQIHGKPDYLQQQPVQNQIRALLLAAIRSAVLWRQVGGKRRHFIFSRQRMIATAHDLLRVLSSQSESSE